MVFSENVETVTIKGDWHVHLLKVAFAESPMAELTFSIHELSSQDLTTSIVDKQEQAALRTSIFKPSMIRAIDLNQFSPSFSALAWRVYRFRSPGLGNVQVLADHQPA